MKVYTVNANAKFLISYIKKNESVLLAPIIILITLFRNLKICYMKNSPKIFRKSLWSENMTNKPSSRHLVT